jgi:hypothetical protein
MTNEKPNAIEHVGTALELLTHSFNELKSSILNSQSIKGSLLRIDNGQEITGDTKEGLIKALGDWDIHPSSTAGEVTRYIGCFAVKEEITNKIHQFNDAKENLTKTSKNLTSLGISEREMRSAYAKNGFPLLHPLQARRLIRVICNQNLRSISFSIAKSIESIEKVTVKTARQRLESNDAWDILDMIANLSSDDQVRWHKPVNTHIRANIVHRSEEGVRSSKMIHCSLPIIISNANDLPKIVFNQPRERRKKRNDTLSTNKIPLPFISEGYLSFDF